MITIDVAKIISTIAASISTVGVGGILIYAIIFKSLSGHLRNILEVLIFIAILFWIGALK